MLPRFAQLHVDFAFWNTFRNFPTLIHPPQEALRLRELPTAALDATIDLVSALLRCRKTVSPRDMLDAAFAADHPAGVRAFVCVCVCVCVCVWCYCCCCCYLSLFPVPIL
jgi:hypothetical protein